MSRGYGALVPAVVLALGACAAQSNPTIDLAAEEQAIRAVSMRWLQLEKSKDAAAIAALFTTDGVMYREDSDPATGAAAIQAHLTKTYQQNPNEVVDWATDGVEVAASGDFAVENGTWTVQNSGPSGTTEDRGKYVTVFRKIDGAWKVAADMSISTVPAPTPSTP